MLRFSPNPNRANLIRWFDCEDDAFEAARTHDRPVMLFLSAFWCRYCQRMDEGAFSERENMALLNAYFIALRVENATRPDIDARYNLNGWPTIAFFSPAGELLGASNYLDGDPFKDLLLNVYIHYQEKHFEQREPESIVKTSAPRPNVKVSPAKALEEISGAILAQADRVYGGYGTGQKFIHPAANEFLLWRYETMQQADCLEHVCRTLDEMRRGQIHDHEAGGYFRTTTGADWTQPHREKLLVEHAGLLSNCIQVFRLSGRDEYARMAEEIIAYLERTLFDPRRGAFFGCEDFLRQQNLNNSPAEEFYSIIDECAYSDANALVSRAYLLAAAHLGRPDCRSRAIAVIEFLWNCCRTAGQGMFHYHDGSPRLPGLLEDQAAVGIALLHLYYGSGDAKHLDRARELAEFIQTRLRNPAGGYFDVSAQRSFIHKAPLTDIDQNGVAASFFLRLARASGETEYQAAADWALDSFDEDLAPYGIHAARFGQALLERLQAASTRGLF